MAYKSSLSIKDKERFLEGFNNVCDAVKVTMGGEGKLVVFQEEFMGHPVVTKDGVTVAKNVFQEEDMEKAIGGNMAKEVAVRTLTSAGDATTTSLVMSQAFLETVGEYPFTSKVKKGLDIAHEEFKEKLNSVSRKGDSETYRNIATVAANGSKDIGDTVTEAYEKVQWEGTVNVELSNKASDEIVHSKGMRLKSGWVSPHMINDQKRGTFDASDPLVIVYEGYMERDRIALINSLITGNRGKPTVIFTEQIIDDIRDKISQMNSSGDYQICVVKMPEYDEKRRALFKDVATYTGAKVFLEGTSQEFITGTASKIIIDESSTTIIQDDISKDVEELIDNLTGQLEHTSETDFIKSRIDNLQGGAATIKVGGITPPERKERFDRFDDSKCAVKSAVEEGYIAGGGSALIYIANSMKKTFENVDEQAGYDFFKRALNKPFLQICENGRVDGTKLLKGDFSEYGIGYDIVDHEFVNMFDRGIIDPTKSIRVAVENALSVVKLICSVDVVMTK